MDILEAYKHFGYPSAAKLHLLLNKTISLKTINEALKGQSVKQLYYQKPKFAGGHIIALNPLDTIQIDLTFMDKFGKYNEGYNYILLAIDVFSRFIWAEPLKTKGMKEIVRAMEYIPKPNCFVSDNGGEFVGSEFQKLCDKEGIIHQTVLKGDHHALGIIDRMTRTLKNYLYKGFIANDNVKWKTELARIVEIYNETPNSGIYNYTPNEAFHSKSARIVLQTINTELQGGKHVGTFAVGDFVRIRLLDQKSGDKFKRGFTPKWSSEIYKIEDLDGSIAVVNGKRIKCINLQNVPENSNGGEDTQLKVATKEHKVKRVLSKEGVSDVNIREKRERAIKFDKSLIGRLINRGDGETGKITKYDPEGDYNWFVKYDKKAKLKHEWMDANEVRQFLVS